MQEFILSMLLSLPASYRDINNETSVQRESRMSTVASAIVEVVDRATCTNKYNKSDCKKIWFKSKKELAVALVTLAKWESNLAKNVHEGKCGKHECDPFLLSKGKYFHQAHSLWQVHVGGPITHEQWENMVGVNYEPTREAAWGAARIYLNSWNKCKTVQGAMSMYMGHSCDWNDKAPKDRAEWFKIMMNTPDSKLQSDAQKRMNKMKTKEIVSVQPSGRLALEVQPKEVTEK